MSSTQGTSTSEKQGSQATLQQVDQLFDTYIRYFETMSIETIDQLDKLATEDLHFKDPFHEVHSRDKVKKIFSHSLKIAESPEFSILDQNRSGNKLWVTWRFSFSVKLLGRLHKLETVGASLIEARDSQIAKHIDYWDASSQLYCQLPYVGWFFRMIANFFAAKGAK